MEYVMSCPVGCPVKDLCRKKIDITFIKDYDSDMSIGKIDERLKTIMQRKGFRYPSQLALYFQVSEQTVRTWLKGVVPNSGSKIWDQLKCEEE